MSDPWSSHASNPVSPDPHAWVRQVVIARRDLTWGNASRQACILAFPHGKVSTYRQGFAALDRLRRGSVDVLLLGVDFTDLDGIDLLDYVVDHRLAQRVIVMPARPDEASPPVRFDGLIDPETETVSSLVSALRSVAAGEPYVSGSLRGELIDRQIVGTRARKLTVAELAAFCALVEGGTDTAAAGAMGLNETTVQTRRRNLMRKLHVSTHSGLLGAAIRLGLARLAQDGTVMLLGSRQKYASLRRSSLGDKHD